MALMSSLASAHKHMHKQLQVGRPIKPPPARTDAKGTADDPVVGRLIST